MPIIVEATYQDGVLKPVQPLPLPDQAKVRLTIEPSENWVQATAGLFRFQGSREEAEYVAADAELDFPLPEQS